MSWEEILKADDLPPNVKESIDKILINLTEILIENLSQMYGKNEMTHEDFIEDEVENMRSRLISHYESGAWDGTVVEG
tara:strand:+ start:192 stop:425 length:234 start_codon:yes stop_codon:yes gene_type:complete